MTSPLITGYLQLWHIRKIYQMHKNNCRVDANLLPHQKGTRARNPPLIFHELINTSCINAPSVLNVMETMLEISIVNSPLTSVPCSIWMRLSRCSEKFNLRKIYHFLVDCKLCIRSSVKLCGLVSKL